VVGTPLSENNPKRLSQEAIPDGKHFGTGVRTLASRRSFRRGGDSMVQLDPEGFHVEDTHYGAIRTGGSVHQRRHGFHCYRAPGAGSVQSSRGVGRAPALALWKAGAQVLVHHGRAASEVVSEHSSGPPLTVIALGQAQPIPIFQQLARRDPAGRNDVRAYPLSLRNVEDLLAERGDRSIFVEPVLPDVRSRDPKEAGLRNCAAPPDARAVDRRLPEGVSRHGQPNRRYPDSTRNYPGEPNDFRPLSAASRPPCS
jgi:hypothetical protein